MTPERWEEIKPAVTEALALAPGERAARLRELRSASPGLAEEIASLVAAAESDPEFLEAPAWERLPAAGLETNERPPERVGPWRLGERIGRGGMGSVFRAHRDDGAFAREVAVKIVREELGGAWLRRRFLAERRILAGLEHPNIARLIDGGSTESGVPYLVLELVAGEPIDRFADARALDVAARLRLFAKVARTVAYAHRRLVLHRDLKSSNILVDGRGEPKLLDFGVAKLLSAEDEEAESTRLGAPRPLTPEWASPEQLRGEALTIASDVYSLGVLLHLLLAGERPHGATAASRGARERSESPAARAERIEARGDVRLRDAAARGVPPGVERRVLAGDLEWIVARSLAPEPERRYSSAEELADDVERFLAGRTVRAHPPSFAYRARKFLRRHRAAAGATVAIAASLIGATVISLAQAARAERERQRAERRSEDVRRLANAALFEVHDAIADLSGSLPARAVLVEKALAYLEDLAREAGDSPALLLEVASGYERIAEIQGMPSWPSGGRSGDALTSLEHALALRQRAASIGGLEAEPLAGARILARIGTVVAARGEPDRALELHRQAERILDAGRATAPSIEIERELAIVRVAVGDDLWETGDLAGARDAYLAALGPANAARRLDPAAIPALRQVGVIEQRLGDAAAERADWAEALSRHRASLAVDREILERDPEHGEALRDLGTDLSRAGADALKLERAGESLAHHREAMALRERLLADAPRDARAIEDAAESRFETARALAARGDAALALERWRGLVRHDPSNVRWRDTLASALATAAGWDAAAGDRGAALAKVDEALGLRRAIATGSPEFAPNAEALAALEIQAAELAANRSARPAR